MQLTEHFKLSMPDPADRVSLSALNENAEKLDAALQGHADELGIRARMQEGAWVGETPSEYPKTYTMYRDAYGGTRFEVTAPFGTPAPTDKDIKIVTDFEPRTVFVSGYMSEKVNWEGYVLGYEVEYGSPDRYYKTYTAYSVSGQAFVGVEMTIQRGSESAVYSITDRWPYVREGSVGGYSEKGFAAWSSSVGSSVYHSNSPKPSVETARISFAENADGTWTTTIHGNSDEYGTASYADIEGMTYHWVAFG